jgi:hypothetical protein
MEHAMKLLTFGLLLAVVLFAGAAGAKTNQRYEAKASVAAHRKEARKNARRHQHSRAQGRHHRGHPAA